MTTDTLRPRRVARRAAASAVVWLTLAGSVAAPARAVPKSGDAVLVNGRGTAPVGGGGSTTLFSIRLPDGAACPGDSEEGQYRVQSFIVPATVDPGTVRYRGTRPVAENGWALYGVDTRTFVNAATAKAAAPGGEGVIINVPVFSFGVFEPGMIPAGRYVAGIACSLFAETVRYWSTEIVLVADAGESAGFAWTVVDPPPGAAPTRSTPQGGRLLTLGVAVAAAGSLALRGRARRRRAAVQA